MAKLVVQMLCNEIGARSNAANQSSQFLRMQAVGSKDSADNAKIQGDGAALQGSFNLDGFLASIAETMDAGQTYTVSIDVTPSVVSAPSS